MGGFDFDVIFKSYHYLFAIGMVFTLKLTFFSMLGGIFFGTIMALMRQSNLKVISYPAGMYVNLMRSIPLILVIFWFYFLVPQVGAWVLGQSRPIYVGAFASSLITFVMFETAYFCEIIRSGINSVPKGQVLASKALGMNFFQQTIHIVLPQAFRNMLPVLLTQTIILFQDVSLVYVLSITDFVGAASKIAQRDNRIVEMYIFVALVYFVICFSASKLVKVLQSKIAINR